MPPLNLKLLVNTAVTIKISGSEKLFQQNRVVLNCGGG